MPQIDQGQLLRALSAAGVPVNLRVESTANPNLLVGIASGSTQAPVGPLSDSLPDPITGLQVVAGLAAFSDPDFAFRRLRTTPFNTAPPTVTPSLVVASAVYGILTATNGPVSLKLTTADPGGSETALITRALIYGDQNKRVAQGPDNSANALNKLPTLPARANAAPPAWTEGNQVPLSVDLSGNLRTNPSDRPTREIGRTRTWGEVLTEATGELTAPAANALIAEQTGIPAGGFDVFWSCMAADTTAVGKRVRIMHTDSANATKALLGGCAAPGQSAFFHNRRTFALNDKVRALVGAAGAAGSTYQAYIATRPAG